MKKWLCILLALCLVLALAACSAAPSEEIVSEHEQENAGDEGTKSTTVKQGDEQKDDENEGEEPTVTTTGYTKKTRPTTASKTKKTTQKNTNSTSGTPGGAVEDTTPRGLKEAGLLLTHGRVTADGDGLLLPYSDCGITLSGELEGDVALTMNFGNNGGVINVVVDGDFANVQTKRCSSGYQFVMVCSDLKKGNHTIEITRGTAKNYGDAVIQSISYGGTLKKPTAKSLQLEFIGDSVTCSEGSIKAGGYSVDGHNSFFGYAAITARNLNAGLAVEAICGQKTAGMRGYFNGGSWDFANHQKDIVVVNLGTNDIGWPSSTVSASFKSDVMGLIGDIRTRYGKDTYIVWAYGMMFDRNKAALQAAVEQYAADNNDARVMFCDMSSVKDTSGYGSHPSAQGHANAAVFLTAYLKQYCGA